MKLTAEDQSKLRDKELANIIRKLNSGKTLTAREEAKLAEASAGSEINASGFVSTWDDLAQRIGATRKAIQNWRDDPRYAPEIERRRNLLERADGRHCVAEWLRLMVDLNLKRGAAAAYASDDPENAGDDGDGRVQPPLYGGTQHDWTKAKIAKEVERKDLEIGSLKGTFLVATELEMPLGATFASIQTKLAQFPARVARYLAGLRDVGEIEDRLRDELDADLGDLNAAGYTAESAVAEAVAALPFDEETERLFKLVTFDGQDRAAFLQLVILCATRALQQLGRQVIAQALRDKDTPDLAIADEATGQVSAAAEESISARRNSAAAVPAKESQSPGKSPSSKKRSKRKKLRPADPPGEVEGAIVAVKPKKGRFRSKRRN